MPTYNPPRQDTVIEYLMQRLDEAENRIKRLENKRSVVVQRRGRTELSTIDLAPGQLMVGKGNSSLYYTVGTHTNPAVYEVIGNLVGGL